MTPLYSVSELSVSLRGRTSPGRRLVDRVSFEIWPGRALGLLGRSGSGKTLTALALAGLLPPGIAVSGGSLRFAGLDLTAASEPELQALRGRKIGFVFQEPALALHPALTIGEQVSDPLRVHGGLSGSRLADRVAELLALVGLADPGRVVRSYPHELSGGMRQRSLVALALAADPVFLVADEPTTALDAAARSSLLGVFERLRRERDMALLLISHDAGALVQACQELVVLSAGKVLERGRSAEVASSPSHPETAALLAAARAP